MRMPKITCLFFPMQRLSSSLWNWEPKRVWNLLYRQGSQILSNMYFVVTQFVCVFVWKMKQHCYGKTELKRAQNKHHKRHFLRNIYLMNYRPQRKQKHSYIICWHKLKEIMKLIFRNGSLSHAILFLAN